MFHATYVGVNFSNLNIEVKAAPSGQNYPLTLQSEYPQSIPADTASAVRIQLNTGWTEFLNPVYTPTEVPGSSGLLYINWSPDDQVIILMDDPGG